MVEKKHMKGKKKGDVLVYALSTCIWCKKTKEYLSSKDVAFDYIYVAPPQYKQMWKDALLLIDENTAHLNPDGVVIAQIDPDEREELALQNLELYDERRYGKTLVNEGFFPDEANLITYSHELDTLGRDPELLKSVLSYHVVAATLKAAAIESNTQSKLRRNCMVRWRLRCAATWRR